jgi:hypothetical protein
MFRATLCSSPGESVVAIQHPVYVTLCRWPSGMQVGKELSDLHTGQWPTQSDIYQMLYWYNWPSWWWAQGCSKHVENRNRNIYKRNCASIWLFVRIRHLNVCYCSTKSEFRQTNYASWFRFQSVCLKMGITRQSSVEVFLAWRQHNTWHGSWESVVARHNRNRLTSFAYTRRTNWCIFLTSVAQFATVRAPSCRTEIVVSGAFSGLLSVPNFLQCDDHVLHDSPTTNLGNLIFSLCNKRYIVLHSHL